MLPFQKNKEASVSVAPDVIKRDSDEPKEDHDYGLEACGSDLIAAVKSGDASAVGAALKAAFELCDSQPHQEGPHV